MNANKPERYARSAATGVTALAIAWNFCIATFVVKPFWRDEWCIIYNLKFRTAKSLWGPLDFTQQFPRVYLQIIKCFTAFFNYNYFSLRFPSFLIGTAASLFSYSLVKKFFPEPDWRKYLFTLIIISQPVFVAYFVQMKHYEMEILLAIVALWQLKGMLELAGGIKPLKPKYIVLCLSFVAAPFFSYTYPVAVAPVFAVVFFSIYLKRKDATWVSPRLTPSLLPAVLACAGLALFYIADGRQLLEDKNMHAYWQFRMRTDGNIGKMLTNVWLLFAGTGAGFVFKIVFGILNIAALAHNIKVVCTARVYNWHYMLRLYIAVLFLIVFVLFFMGQLPAGEAKFTAFLTPAVAAMDTLFLYSLARRPGGRKFSSVLSVILFVALAGNIVTNIINTFTNPEYRKRVAIYVNTERALTIARSKKEPITVTPGIGYPDSITKVIPHVSMPSPAGVLKTFPAYDVHDTVAVYDAENITSGSLHPAVPEGTKKVMAIDGDTYRELNCILR